MDIGRGHGDEVHPDGDRDPAALDRVRRDLADLGSDADSAPEVPPAVTARVLAALRSAPAHTVGRPRTRRWHVFGLIVGVGAAVAAAGIGAWTLARGSAPHPALATGPTAERITVTNSGAAIPLSRPQLVDLLSRPPDYGPLTDPARRASCLGGLGYPALTKVLGARTLDMSGRPAVLMLLPGDGRPADGGVVAMVVTPDCSAAHTGLLAHTPVTHP